jgi:hypothetical protein
MKGIKDEQCLCNIDKTSHDSNLPKTDSWSQKIKTRGIGNKNFFDDKI